MYHFALLTDAGGVGAGGVGAGGVGAGAVGAGAVGADTVDPFWHCEIGIHCNSDEAQHCCAVEYEVPHEGLRP